jgi:hypothetical protein
MAEVVRSTLAPINSYTFPTISAGSICSVNPAPADLMGYNFIAGAAIAAADSVYVASDGKVYPASGAAANAAARVRGQAAQSADIGGPVTIARGLCFYYAAGLTPGADLFLSGTVPGGLATTASTGGTVPIAYAVTDTIVEFFRAN